MASEEIKTADVSAELETTEDTPVVEEAVTAEEEEKVEKESFFYEHKMQNRINVTARGRGGPSRLGNFVDRARRILRCDEQLTVVGFGQAISMACTLVELLKRQKIATIKKVSTTMDTQPSFRSGRLQWSRPVTTVTFILERGDFAEYVADYHQRKVIEIFEFADSDHTGSLDVTAVEKLDVAGKFYSNEDRVASSQAFLAKESGDLDLPTFIKYCSILIDPLLKDKVFKERLKEFGISHNDSPPTRA